jgi:hypothetical protein
MYIAFGHYHLAIDCPSCFVKGLLEGSGFVRIYTGIPAVSSAQYHILFHCNIKDVTKEKKLNDSALLHCS